MNFINPYCKQDYKIFEKLYLESLENDPFEIYMRILKLVFGK